MDLSPYDFTNVFAATAAMVRQDRVGKQLLVKDILRNKYTFELSMVWAVHEVANVVVEIAERGGGSPASFLRILIKQLEQETFPCDMSDEIQIFKWAYTVVSSGESDTLEEELSFIATQSTNEKSEMLEAAIQALASVWSWHADLEQVTPAQFVQDRCATLTQYVAQNVPG